MPDPRTPPAFGFMVPVARSVERVCGREYYDSQLAGDAEMMFCACGTGAIGRCVNDHRPVCGYHSALREDRRLCDECLARFDEHARTREVANHLRPLRLLLDHVARMDDPADRFLVLRLIPIYGVKFYGFKEEVENLLANAVLMLLPQTGEEPWHLGNGHPRAWTFEPGPLLQRWRRSNRLSTPVELQRVHDGTRAGRGGLWSVVDGVVDAWQIEVGRLAPSGPLSGSSDSPDIYVLGDGTKAVVKFQSREVYWRRNRREVSLDDIIKLVELGYLSLPPLPPEALAVFTSITGFRA
jgi:hypothetical protein